MSTFRFLSIFRSIIVLSIITLFVGCSSSSSTTTPTTFSISGTVSGAVSSGVTITLSGTSSATTQTDANGNYSFSSLANGTYTVTPTLTGYTFTPTSSTKTVSGSSITAVDFVATIVTANSDMWTWVSGSSTVDQWGVYGTKGVPAGTNMPGSRNSHASWSDSAGNFWLFGGFGYDSIGSHSRLNDLWKFDGTNWTWVSGANTVNQAGVYSTKGVSASTNIPGARMNSTSWTDNIGNLWLFGGNNSSNQTGCFNDLWKFDGTNWTWVSGDNTVNQPGIYGSQGVSASTNMPGSRCSSVSWKDSTGNFWLFGGNGYDTTGNKGELNDLWKFDGTNWTWVSGDNTVNQPGVYGTKGVPAGTNMPGSRGSSVSWTDSKGNFWLFGGAGYDGIGTFGALNDLWKFDGTNWTWVSGSNTANQPGVYGSQGVAASMNTPGGHGDNVSWKDSKGNFWLFGGFGYDSAGNQGNLNDLWKFDGTNWTWVSGDNTVNQPGVYGTKGVPASTNIPGARNSSVSWTDSTGNLWLFGGNSPSDDDFNDLWKFEP